MWAHSLRHACRGHTRRMWPHLTAAPTLRAAPSDPLRVPKTAAQTRVCGVGQRAQSQPSAASSRLACAGSPDRQLAPLHDLRSYASSGQTAAGLPLKGAEAKASS